MIKVTVLYPNGPGAKFDMNYYLSSHMPMVKQRIGAAVKGMSVDEGLGGVEPGSAPAYLAIGHLFFESLDAFQLALCLLESGALFHAQPVHLLREDAAELIEPLAGREESFLQGAELEPPAPTG